MRTLPEVLRRRHRALGLLGALSQAALAAALGFAAFVLLRPAEVIVLDARGFARVVRETDLPIEPEDAEAFVVAFTKARAVPFYGEHTAQLARAETYMSAPLRRLEAEDGRRRGERLRYIEEIEARRLRAKLHHAETTCRPSGAGLWACELKAEVAVLAGERPEAWVLVLRAFAEEVRRTRKSPFGLLIVHYALEREVRS